MKNRFTILTRFTNLLLKKPLLGDIHAPDRSNLNLNKCEFYVVTKKEKVNCIRWIHCYCYYNCLVWPFLFVCLQVFNIKVYVYCMNQSIHVWLKEVVKIMFLINLDSMLRGKYSLNSSELVLLQIGSLFVYKINLSQIIFAHLK